MDAPPGFWKAPAWWGPDERVCEFVNVGAKLIWMSMRLLIARQRVRLPRRQPKVMPECRLCHERFPCRVVINGRTRLIAGRKYCLKCSPFGAKNTRRLEVPSEHNRICSACSRGFVLDHKRGNTGTICGSCRVMRRKTKLKRMALEYKGGKCERCAYNKCSRALQFHHRDPGSKIFHLAEGTPSWERVKQELDKCDLLCANCHIEAEDALLTGRRVGSRHLTVNQKGSLPIAGSSPAPSANIMAGSSNGRTEFL